MCTLDLEPHRQHIRAFEELSTPSRTVSLASLIMEGWDDDGKRVKNTLPLYGNKDSMNLNSMILTNIVGSPYFKEELIQYKTFHEVVDQIYYKVDHLEPWEKNSRKLAGQVGMCAGVRGVAAGGIVSSAFCLLYKMFTLKLTRKQVSVMINHGDSPYIRGVGFLYVRYCQPPADFWDWFSPYLEDEEEIDLKAGGGYQVTIGEMCRMMLSTLDWFGTLFPRLPVVVQKDLTEKLKAIPAPARARREPEAPDKNGVEPAKDDWGEAGRRARQERLSRSPRRERRDRSPERSYLKERRRSRSRERKRNRSSSRDRRRSRSRDRRRRSRSRDRRRSRSRERRNRSSSRERRRSRSRDRRSRRSPSDDRSGRSRRRSRSKDRRERSRSRDRKERSRSRERRGRSKERKSRSHSRERRNR